MFNLFLIYLHFLFSNYFQLKVSFFFIFYNFSHLIFCIVFMIFPTFTAIYTSYTFSHFSQILINSIITFLKPYFLFPHNFIYSTSLTNASFYFLPSNQAVHYTGKILVKFVCQIHFILSLLVMVFFFFFHLPSMYAFFFFSSSQLHFYLVFFFSCLPMILELCTHVCIYSSAHINA